MSPKSHNDLFAGGGEMGALMASIDWSQTSLGLPEQWPQSLQTAVSVCLFSRFPMFLWWGPDLIQIYNDAYRPILGTTKHPAAMGQPGKETWSEIWHIIGPMLEGVYREGKATWSDDQMLPIDRHDFVEEAYFTFSYSPIFDESGGIGGVFTAVTETTGRVLNERRLRMLRVLGVRASEGKTGEEACQIAAITLESSPADIAFALIYLLDERKEKAYLAGRTGIEAGSDLGPNIIDMTGDDAPWSFLEMTASEHTILVDDLKARFNDVPMGLWPEPPHRALVLPIMSYAQNQVTGYLMVGLSPRLLFDDNYRGFFGLIAGHISTAVANALAFEQEHKRLEALAEQDRAKTEFFSNVSHEFRTPLTLMINPIQELLREVGATWTAHQRDNLEMAQRNSLRLLKLVNTLLDFSRIQAHRIDASYEPTDLSAMTVDLASNFRSAIEGAGMKFIVDCPPLAEPVYTDRDMWEKIILNLLSNAFKFTFEGEIAVTVRMLAEYVTITIRDTGIGIPESELLHIFDRFHRVRGARARTHEGSGIGLSLVQELVKFHGGDIRVESQVGTGTTFTIALPRGYEHLPAEQLGAPRRLSSTSTGAASYVEEAMRWQPDIKATSEIEAVLHQPAEPNSSIPALPSINEASARILVVDDNADMRDYLSRLLQQRYQVETANDGEMALRRIRQQRPDLVLADIMMPNLDGFGLLERIRANPTTRLMPVILLSARAGEEARIEGLEAGADDYLVKPFSMRELMASVSANLQIAQLRQHILQQEQKARAEIERLIESIADPFYFVDAEWRFVYANARAQQMWDKDQKALIGSTIWDLFPDQVDTQAYQEMHRAVDEQQAMTFETFTRLLNTWVEISLYPTYEGLAVFFRDIGKRKRAEEAANLVRFELDAERQRIIDIFASISDAFVVLDREYRYTYLNCQAVELCSKLFGQPLDYFLGNIIWEVIPDLYDSPFGEIYRRAMTENVFIQFEDFFEPIKAWFEVRVYPSKEGLSIYFADITERYKSQNALREAEERLRTMIDSAKDYAIFAFDLEGLITSWNTGAERLFGYSEEEILGQKEALLYTPEDVAALIPQREMRKAVEVGYAENERWHQRKHGTRFYASGMVRPIHNEAGVLQGFTKVARDTTELKLAGQRSQMLQELTSALSASLTVEEVIEVVLDKILAGFGGTQGGVYQVMPGGQMLELIGSMGHDDEYKELYKLVSIDVAIPIATAVQTGEVVTLESFEDIVEQYPYLNEGVRASGIHAMVCLPFYNKNEVVGGMSLCFPYPKKISQEERSALVTMAQLCGQALERARLYKLEQQTLVRTQALQRLTAALSKATMIKEVAQVMTQVLAELGAVTGLVFLLSEDGTQLEIINQQNVPQMILNKFRDVSINSSALGAEAVLTGQPIWLPNIKDFEARYAEVVHLVKEQNAHSAVALPLVYGERPIGVISILFKEPQTFPSSYRDYLMTLAEQCAHALERARLYEAEMQARQVAEKANLLKMQFLGMISHELRTPLASIKGFTTTLLAQDVTFAPERQRTFLSVIDVETNKLTELVEQLLDLSRLQAGALYIEAIPQPFETLLDASQIQLNTLTQQHELLIRIPDDIPPVLVDTQRVAQVLVNLVGNAAKFSLQGTEIVISASHNDQYVQIDVSDTGVGIPPEDRETVFEAFRQIERKTVRQRLGAGLGLAICKGIVEAHGGHIWVQARAVGTTISFVVPVVAT